jgi:DNA-binding transcriptional MerR regulator
MRTTKFTITVTKKQAATMLNVRPSLVQFYTENGLVIPEISASGKGTRRRYSFMNLVEIITIKKLSDAGFSLRLIKLVLKSEAEYLNKYAKWMETICSS